MVKHGKCGTRVYKSWLSMIARVTNPNAAKYPIYGGRGVDLDPRWREFTEFFADLGDPPPGTSLGRIDNERGYWPDNCRWETLEQQANNKRNNSFLTWLGKRQTVTQWARELGISSSTLHARLYRGMTTEQALTTPIKCFKGEN